MIEIFNWIATFINSVAIFFNINQNKICFIFMFIGNIIFIVTSFISKNYAMGINRNQ